MGHVFAAETAEIAQLGRDVGVGLRDDVDAAGSYAGKWIIPERYSAGIFFTYAQTAEELGQAVKAHAAAFYEILEATGAELKKVAAFFADQEEAISRELDRVYNSKGS
ncbi:MAG: hypothetical protein LBG11_02450 [Bifidobacteriaceae bacterium]|jgi:hypothetical protein|nr:hypothetical protein [Bifidobacteriaceae bacterium]